MELKDWNFTSDPCQMFFIVIDVVQQYHFVPIFIWGRTQKYIAVITDTQKHLSFTMSLSGYGLDLLSFVLDF